MTRDRFGNYGLVVNDLFLATSDALNRHAQVCKTALLTRNLSLVHEHDCGTNEAWEVEHYLKARDSIVQFLGGKHD